MLFNPYSGRPRHPSDIASDPAGILMPDPDEPLLSAPFAKPGRKPLTPGAQRVATSVSLTPVQVTRFKALGGSAWLRALLDVNGDLPALRETQR